MKKFLTTLALTASFLSPAIASVESNDPHIEDWNSMHSLGCMLTRECVEGTVLIVDTEHIEMLVQGVDYSNVRDETDAIIAELREMGVNVYLVDEKYFPRGHAGVYYTVGNDFFLNISYAVYREQMLKTLRHESWHAAQDQFACGIENTNLAIIYPMEDVPQEHVLMAEILYPEHARPWEAEAKWAGATPGMTLDVLRIINETNGRPWEVITPTPLTQEWLEAEGCF